MDHQWLALHRSFVVETFFKNNESIIATQRLFRVHFDVGRHGAVPSRNTILSWIANFRNTASAMKIKPSGRPRSVRTPENIETVRQSVLQSPNRSARRQAMALAISDSSLRRILHLDLNFHPYKIVMVQKLNDTDFGSRVMTCQRLLQLVTENDLLNALIMSDEAHFHLSGKVNRQNFRYWSAKNPKEHHETSLHPEKVTVWCGVARLGVIGPYFFEDERGSTVTVNAERYVEMLRGFLVPQLQLLGFDMTNTWFQQDGATCHTAIDSMEVLRELFPGKLISRFGDVPWSARSPDLTSCDCWLWGYLKSKVFVSKPRTIPELKQCIREEIAAIPQVMLRKVTANMQKRWEACVEVAGHHLSDIIFHK